MSRTKLCRGVFDKENRSTGGFDFVYECFNGQGLLVYNTVLILFFDRTYAVRVLLFKPVHNKAVKFIKI
jgi:hypothetical protein